MSLDLIEIALDRITDAAEFERLAAEVMYLQGYHDIKPLGGVHDLGKDAIQDRFFHRVGRSKIVFQFTLEEYLPGKLRRTVKRLAEASIEYSELVLVTPRRLSSERQEQLIEMARRDHDITVSVFERKAIVVRLADPSNGLFQRHFPSIEQQIQLIRSSEVGTSPVQTPVEEGLLRASLAFVFGARSATARKALFDEVVLAVLAEMELREFTTVEVHALLREALPAVPPEVEQVRASLGRAVRAGWAKQASEESVVLTPEGKTRVIAALSKAQASVGLLVSDVVGKVAEVADDAISQDEEGRLQRNGYALLAHFFRLFGIELTGQLLEGRTTGPVFLQATPDLLRIASQQVTPPLGELLIAATAEVIENPTEEQARALANWARAFVGSALLNIDPMSRKLHQQELSGRTFILDTDVVLDVVVREVPRSESLRSVVESVLALGARVIVPTTVLEECARHAERSFKTWKHFGRTLFGMDAGMIERKVHNAFVAGFAHGRLRGRIGRGTTFRSYLENYYESADPVAFFTQVALLALPEGVGIIAIDEMLGSVLDEKRVALFHPVMVRLAGLSAKAQYRSSEETCHLGKTDAVLIAATLQMCESERGASRKGPFARQCYLVTNSGRYQRACVELGIGEASSTRPQQLLSIVELLGGEPVSDMEFVRLFENPFLVAAVDQIWESAKVLLDDGLSLVGKNLARLRWDLGKALHERITKIEEMGRAPADATVADQMDEEGAELILDSVRLGYRLNPAFEVVQRAMSEKEAELDAVKQEFAELSERHEELQRQIEVFGRRRQRYLRKLAEHRR